MRLKIFYGQSELKAETNPNVALPRNIEKVSLAGKRRLLLSDNPETFTENTFNVARGTLWHDKVSTISQLMSHRVFAWHVNETGSKIKIGVILENLNSASLAIKNFGEVNCETGSNGDFISEVGIPLAKAVIDSSLGSLKDVNKCNPNGVSLIKEYLVPNKTLIGFIHEFDVCTDTNKEMNYIVRVVVSKHEKDDLTTIRDSPVANDGLHYRGSWEQADMLGNTQTYTVGERLGISISNGVTDNIQIADTSFDSINATNNPGHYGVIYRLCIPILNPCQNERTVLIGINPRGGDYAGAVSISTGNNFKIPILKTLKSNYANIMRFVAKPGISYAELSFMHAGAASLPISIQLSTI